MSEAAIIAVAAAIIGGVSGLLGAFVGAWAQHRFLLKQFKLKEEEDERKRLDALERSERAEREALILSLTDLRDPRGRLDKHSRWFSSHDHNLSFSNLERLSTPSLKQLSQMVIADASAEHLEQVMRDLFRELGYSLNSSERNAGKNIVD